MIPIADTIIKARRREKSAAMRASIVYPMDALANSELEEIQKILEQSGLSADLQPTVERYAGQYSDDEREVVRNHPPDILLTNFMMTQLSLTRQDERDRKVVENASALAYIGLDELRTYCRRQASDKAVLIRQLKAWGARAHELICIGTSATMANERTGADRAAAVAEASSRFFGTYISPADVIDETLRWAIKQAYRYEGFGFARLREAVTALLPIDLSDSELGRQSPGVWREDCPGLIDDGKLRRRKLIGLDEAARLLHQITGIELMLAVWDQMKGEGVFEELGLEVEKDEHRA